MAQSAPEPLNRHIIRQLIAAREAEGWTQREVANRLGMYPGTYANYEAETRNVPFHVIQRAAALYGRSICWFVDPEYAGVADDAVAPELRALLSAVPLDRQRALIGVFRELVRAG